MTKDRYVPKPENFCIGEGPERYLKLIAELGVCRSELSTFRAHGALRDKCGRELDAAIWELRLMLRDVRIAKGEPIQRQEERHVAAGPDTYLEDGGLSL